MSVAMRTVINIGNRSLVITARAAAAPSTYYIAIFAALRTGIYRNIKSSDCSVIVYVVKNDYTYCQLVCLQKSKNCGMSTSCSLTSTGSGPWTKRASRTRSSMLTLFVCCSLVTACFILTVLTRWPHIVHGLYANC